MKLKKIQIIFFVAIVLTFFTSSLRDTVEADDTDITNTSETTVTTGGAVTSGGALEVVSPDAINATGTAITSQSAIEEKEEPLPVEVDDEITLGGILYLVTEIKDRKVYVEVTGVVNDRTTTVYIPKKIEYNNIEMTVNSIGEESFSYLERLRKIVIAADITRIGKSAFEGAEKFSRLVIKTNALKKVEKNIFKDVSNKLIIEVPKKKLGSYKKLFKNKGIKVKEIKAIK